MMVFAVLAALRGQLFWFIDSLTGSMVRNAYGELADYEQLASNSEELERYRETALNRLLKHAVNTTPFYKQYNEKKLQLNVFPVISKEIIRAEQDRFLSYLYNQKQLTTMTTSGSTGTPFTCYQNKEKKKRVNAEVIHYSKKSRYRVGRRLINLKSAGGVNGKDRFRQLLQNIVVLDVGRLDETGIRELLEKIEEASKEGAMLLAYASTYEALSRYFEDRGSYNNCNIYGMISSSELLFDSARLKVEEAFGCRCYSRYSNQENGIIGQDEEENNVFILNEAHYIIEILELGSDQPVQEGEAGRIIITDLYNYAMPMIRYDTGDVGAVTYVEHNGVRKKALTGFKGRKIDLVYDSSGRSLSPHKISVTLRYFNEVRQFQFIQQGEAEYLVRLKVEGAFEKEEELLRQLKALLGEKTQVKFDYPDEIPALKSGKRNYIINQMTEGHK